MDFISISGWLFGLISFIFGIIQLIQKNKYKKQLNFINKQEQKIGKKSTGYQTGNNSTININK
ncbi:MAG: hypothetical protein HN704_03175 [Bacteroidetes bacterium]|nr:hypothetical protein [Bacteroidota bacterium]MBT6686988.1 hypothetical protein [Bacteroidota bacterium]MBT7142410.1 hypothetical protein [Bacteroidota bacterium]MBT7490591.1 hypothetical protein [Bacteroidota bacterium]